MSSTKTNIYKSFLVIIVILISEHFCAAQNLAKLKFSWKKPAPFIEIPEQYKKEDAVAIYQEIYLSNNYDPNSKVSLFSTYSIKKRIRILTKNAIEELTNFPIDQFPGSTPVTIDARTIKKNGETIVAGREGIREMKKYNKLTGNYIKQYRISIPGVEVGDDIEIVYAVEKDKLTYSTDIYLHGDYPILKSTFTLYTARGIITEIMNHNDIPLPSRVNQTDMTIDTWELQNLKPLKDQSYMIDDTELPFVRIHISKFYLPGMNRPYEVGIKSWGEIYDGITSDVFNKNQKSKGFTEFLDSFKSSLDTMGTMAKVSFMVNYLNKEITFVNQLDDKEKNLPLANLIKLKKIDNSNLICFYENMFSELKIAFSMVLAKNKYNGDLAYEEKTYHQINDVFFSFKTEKGDGHFLYPSDYHEKFHVDERPYYLEGTKIILLHKNDSNPEAIPDVNFSRLTPLPIENNIRSINCHYKISENGDAASVTKGNYSGILSSYLRREWEKVIHSYDKKDILEWLNVKDTLNFQLDTLIEESNSSEDPFNFKYRIKNTVKDVVTDAGEGVQSLKVHVIPEHFTFSYSKNERTTTAFFPFRFTDELIVFIEFPSPVTVLNNADILRTMNNNIGSFDQTLVQIDPKTYKLSSTFKCRSSVIPPDQYHLYIELVKAIEQSEDINILYKIK